MTLPTDVQNKRGGITGGAMGVVAHRMIELVANPGLKMAIGTEAVTGDTSAAPIKTGLTTIQFAFAAPVTTTQGAGEAAYATVDFTGLDDATGGDLDLYAWDDAGVAATVATDFAWIAFGV